MTKIDCQWIETNIEAYFCDRLSFEQKVVAQNHIQDCSGCREQVQGLNEVDPLVKQVFRYNLAVARTPRRARHWAVIYGTPVAVFATLVIAVLALQSPQPGVVPVPDGASPPRMVAAVPAEAEVPKAPEGLPAERAKPEEAEEPLAPAAMTAPGESRSDLSRPDFALTDAAGYSRTLQDYRGYVLIFGVWTPGDTQTIANIEEIYRTFSSDTRLRILGVAQAVEAKPAGTTFPIAYNHNSRLMGAAPGELWIVDQQGSVRSRIPLTNSPQQILNAVRASLASIGL